MLIPGDFLVAFQGQETQKIKKVDCEISFNVSESINISDDIITEIVKKNEEIIIL